MPLEAKNERDKLNYCMEHPDAHQHAGLPGLLEHRGRSHIHSVNAKSAHIIIYMRLLIPSIYRRINRKIPYFESSESLMLLCIGEVFFDSEECEGLSTSMLHKIADVVLKEGWLCFGPVFQKFHSDVITTPGICGEQSLMETLRQEVQAYHTRERKRALLQKYGREVEDSLDNPVLLNSFSDHKYTRDFIADLLKYPGRFFLTGVEYPNPGNYLLFPSRDLPYWVEKLSPIIEGLCIKDSYV